MSKKSLKDKLETIKTMKTKIITELEKEIAKIENPNGQKECGKFGIIIKFSELSSESWLPNFYDMRTQSKELIEYVKKSNNLDTLFSVLNDIIETGQSKNIKNVKFNQSFREQLRKIIE